MSKITVVVPDIGGYEGVDIIEVCVKEGDLVAEGDSLIVLETDKASMDIPSTAAGTVAKICVKEGGSCSEGDVIVELEAAATSQSTPETKPIEQPSSHESSQSVTSASASSQTGGNETVLIPDLSGATDVDVIEVLVKEGDVVQEGDSIITLETDKASMEVPAPKAGRIMRLAIQIGDQVNENDVLMELEVNGAQTANSPSLASTAIEPTSESASKLNEPVSQGSSSQTVYVPDLSGATDVDVIEVMVKEGDVIEEGDSLIALETDKASMEVPAPSGGKVSAMRIKVGDKVNEGDLLLELQISSGSAPQTQSDPKPVNASQTQTLAQTQAQQPVNKSKSAASASASSAVDLQALEKNNKSVHAGPAVRALAREFGVDLFKVTGTGPKQRILKEDVQLFVKHSLQKLTQSAPASSVGSGIPAIPAVDFSQFGEIEVVKLSKIDKLTRDNMARCWLNIPHVTQFDDADITDLEAFRKEMKDEALKVGVKLTPLPFLIKACAIALKRHKKINSSLHADGENVVFKHYVHIGLAVDTPNGLMVPVIRDADKKSVYALSLEAAELAGKAKDRKLKPAEMQGASFTISSLGGIGGTGFTPIVNAPEVAILGVSKADIKPRWNGKEFEPRFMLPLCLSYDHRAINGSDAGRFLTELNVLLSDIRRLML